MHAQRADSVALSGADLRVVLDTAAAADECVPGEEGFEVLLGALSRLVRCDVVLWNQIDFGPPVRKLGEAVLPKPAVHAPWGDWLAHRGEHPIMSGKYGPVTAISEVMTTQEFHRSWLYREAFCLEGLEHEVGVRLGQMDTGINVISLSRTAGADFSERDRLVLRLLRPHLESAVIRLTSVPPHLTPRESEVMRCVRAGMTDRQVAKFLDMSVGTVGKHLEHVYQRGGVQSRVQALRLYGPTLDSAFGSATAWPGPIRPEHLSRY